MNPSARRVPARRGKRRSLPVGPQGPASRELRIKGAVQVLGRCPGYATKYAAWSRLIVSYLAALGRPGAGVELLLVDDAKCLALNASYRGKPEATDILSFPAVEGAPPAGYRGFLGSLALDLAYAWRHRGRFRRRFEEEAAFLVLHGLLHLCGHHHDTPAAERTLWHLQDRLFPPPAPLLAALRGLRPARRPR